MNSSPVNLAAFGLVLGLTALGFVCKLANRLTGGEYKALLAPVAAQHVNAVRLFSLAFLVVSFSAALGLLVTGGVQGNLDAYYWSAVGVFIFNCVGVAVERMAM